VARALITYCRVSTKAQGRSGLGLEAQRDALARFAMADDLEIVREFIEIETGRGADALDRRPQLAAALAEPAAVAARLPSPSSTV
jgi:DNA invertase Pin-like site-specific DNA recombinase